MTVLPEIETFAAESWATDAAAFVAARIRAAIEARGRCRLGLAGGGTPKPVYEALANIDLPWSKLDLLFGDERCVPRDHAESNYAMVNEALISRITPVGEGQEAMGVHPVDARDGMEAAARAYSLILDVAPTDVLLLGMGGDGHTASLFPGNDMGAGGPRAIGVIGPKPPPERVSMSIDAINESREVIFLITGAGKAERLAEVRAQITSGDPILPAARVQPTGGRLIWLLDPAAASGLAGRGSEPSASPDNNDLETA